MQALRQRDEQGLLPRIDEQQRAFDIGRDPAVVRSEEPVVWHDPGRAVAYGRKHIEGWNVVAVGRGGVYDDQMGVV